MSAHPPAPFMTPHRILPEWHYRAICPGADPTWWDLIGEGMRITPTNLSADNRKAQAICRRCPVAETCLEEAIKMGDQSVIRAAVPFFTNTAGKIRRFRAMHPATPLGVAVTAVL